MFMSASSTPPVYLGFSSDDSSDRFIGTVANSSFKYAFRITQLCPADMLQVRTKSILSGDFVRLFHQEMGGVMICRVDDEAELESKVAPLGRAIKKHSRPSDDIHAVFIRNESSPDQLSGNSIWQILKPDNLHFKNITIDDAVMLRHLTTGQHLCMRLVDGSWSISTSLLPSDNCLFRMTSLDITDVTYESDTLIGSIRFNQNIFFVHLNSQQSLACYSVPPRNIYANDSPLAASHNKVSKTEVYKLRRVSAEQVQDALFAARMLPLVRGATVDLQLMPSDKLYLPLFRHMCVAMETLVRWLADLAEPDLTLLESSKATYMNPDLRIPFSSSLVCWLEREGTDFQQLEFSYTPVQSRDSCATALVSPIKRFRQNLLTDSNILDYLMNFANIAFTLHKAKEASHEKAKLPVVITNICSLIHDLLHVCVLKNSQASTRLILCKGSLQNLVAQFCVLWNPPLAAILNAAIEDGIAANIDIVEESLNELSEYDVRMLVRQMDELHRNSKPAEHILDLMDTLSRYGPEKMVKKYQDYIIAESFETPKLPTHGNHVDEEDTKNVSVFFSTRFSKQHERWEVSLLDSSFELRSGKPTKEDFFSFFNAEYDSLQTIFAHYDSNGNGVLDMEECFALLEELGVAGQSLLDELEVLQSITMHELIRWWWARRNIYFSTYSATLNNVSFKDVEELFRDHEAARLEAESPSPTKLVGWSSVLTSTKSVKLESVPTSHRATPQEIFEFSIQELRQRVPWFSVKTFFEEQAPVDAGKKKNLLKEGGELTFVHPSLVSSKPLSTAIWLPVLELIEQDSPDAVWFMRCMQLFCQLCSNRNLASQVVVNKLLPADCLIRILGESSRPKVKGLVCKLVSDVFVYHDYVFPVGSLTLEQAKYCSIDEISDVSKSVIMGKLFNTDTVFSKRSDPFVLRVKLKDFVLAEVDQFSLVVDSEVAVETYAYQNSLLNLVKALLSIGFFDEDFTSYEQDNLMDSRKHFGLDYLVSLLLQGLKDFYEDLNDLSKLKKEVKTMITSQTLRGEMSEEDMKSLLGRIEKINKGNLGIELSTLANQHFSMRFSDEGVIDVIESIIDVFMFVFEMKQMTSFKEVLSLTRSFEVVFPELSKTTDMSLAAENVFPKINKKVIKSHYTSETIADFEEAKLVMNAFYFERRRLRGKLLSLMQKRLFRTDIRKATETLEFVVDPKESIGKRLTDTISCTLRKYIAEYEQVETNQVKAAHVNETMKCLMSYLSSILSLEHMREEQSIVTKKRTSMFSAFTKVRRLSAFSPLEVEESDYFLDEFEGFFPIEVCSYTFHIKLITEDLLRSVGRLILAPNGDEDSPFKTIDELSLQTRLYIVQVFDFLALIVPSDTQRFALAWLPFDRVVQHLFNMTDNVNRVMEAIYQYHPDLESLVPPELVRAFKDALFKSFETPATWPARIMRAILLNERQDAIYILAKVGGYSYRPLYSNHSVLRHS